MEKPVHSKVTVQEHSVLVDLSQSKKLAALRKQSPILPKPSVINASSSLTSVANSALLQVQQRIDMRIAELMRRLPKGKEQKLFALRFGSVAELKALEIAIACKKLEIDTQDINMRVLASLNYYGDTI